MFDEKIQSSKTSFSELISRISVPATLGLMLLWSWLNTLHGPMAIGLDEIRKEAVIAALIWRTMLPIALLALMILERRFDSPFRNKVLLASGTLCGVFGTAGQLWWNSFESIDEILFAGSVLIGISYAIFLRFWIIGNISVGLKSSILSIAIAMTGNIGIVLITSHLLPPHLSSLLLIFPLGVALSLSPLFEKRNGRLQTRKSQNTLQSQPGIAFLCVALAFCGLVYGFLDQTVPTIFQTLIWALAAFLIGCLFLVLIPKVSKIDINVLIIAILLILCVGILFALFLPSSSKYSSFAVVVGLHAVLMVALVGALWVDSFGCPRRRNAYRTLIAFFGALAVAGWVCCFLPLDRSTMLTVSSILLVFAMVSVFMFRFSLPQDFSAGRKGFSPMHSDVAVDRMIDACEKVGGEYGLTPRESEVLLLLSRGYSIKRIADEFTVSPNTVKTQTHSIYTKVGVHSKQELIKILETVGRNREGMQWDV